jgi:hypothetical protein
MKRFIAGLIAFLAVAALFGAAIVAYAYLHRHFGMVWALCAVGLLLSVFVPAGEAVRRARFWRWLAGD